MSTRPGNRRFFAGFLLVALLVAGVASYYASSHPDGLQSVAEKTGFLEAGKNSPAADGPFADYSTKGIDDARVSGGVAGIAGCLLVLGIGGGLFWVLRRRDPEAEQPTRAPEHAPETSGV